MSKYFDMEHVKEIVPDFFDLCEEYHIKGTVNGHQMPSNIDLAAWHIIDPNSEKIE